MSINRSIIAASIVLVAASQAQAAPIEACVPVKQLANYLMMKYREFPIGSTPGTFPTTVVLYASDTGTWTVVSVNGDQACILDAGSGWAVPTAIRGNGA